MNIKECTDAIATGVARSVHYEQDAIAVDRDFISERLKDFLREAVRKVCPMCKDGSPHRTEGVGIYCHSMEAGLEPCRAYKIWDMITER